MDANIVALDSVDVDWVIRRLPNRVVGVFEQFPGRVFVAGGFIRAVIAGEDPADVDLFVASQTDADLVERRLSETYAVVARTANAVTMAPQNHHGLDVQIITRWMYASAERLVREFDFSVCAAAVWHEPNTGGRGPARERAHYAGIAHERFYPDLASKRLTYLEPQREEEVGGSMLRAMKYARKGYNVPLRSLAALRARVSEGAEAGNGETLTRADVILGRLFEVDPQRAHPA